ncbi:metallophosphoesterase [candidate division KSB1 bacterium]|nr:metallophosphoesterase [candidate division KSB1 bacterium]
MLLRSRTIIYLFLSLFLIAARAQQPGAQPQRIILTWHGDPANSQSVVWRTDAAVTEPQAQLAPAVKHMQEVEGIVRTVAALTETVPLADEQLVYHHIVRFDSLTPAQTYLYRVGDGEVWSEWNTFRTAELERKPFTFIYLGDVQNEIGSQWPPLVRNAFARVPEARFFLYAGDLVNLGGNDANWKEFFDAVGFIHCMLAAVPVPGNHEKSRTLYRSDSTRRIDPLYLTHFDLPLNGPLTDGLEETAYYIDYQGLRLISFNSSSPSDSSQLQWLEQVLRESAADWNIVCHHHPLFSVAGKRDEKTLRQNLMPIYQRYQVDLVLQGHDHRYGRTNKIIDGSTVAATAKAPVYAVSVSGPKNYDHNEKFAHLMRTEIGATQLYQVIKISPEALVYEAWSLDGRRMDGFILHKNPDGGTVLENLSE